MIYGLFLVHLQYCMHLICVYVTVLYTHVVDLCSGLRRAILTILRASSSAPKPEWSRIWHPLKSSIPATLGRSTVDDEDDLVVVRLNDDRFQPFCIVLHEIYCAPY